MLLSFSAHNPLIDWFLLAKSSSRPKKQEQNADTVDSGLNLREESGLTASSEEVVDGVVVPATVASSSHIRKSNTPFSLSSLPPSSRLSIKLQFQPLCRFDPLPQIPLEKPPVIDRFSSLPLKSPNFTENCSCWILSRPLSLSICL